MKATYEMNPSFSCHLLPNLHHTKDDSDCQVIQFKPQGKDKLSFYNRYQLDAIHRKYANDSLTPEILEVISKSYNPNELLSSDINKQSVSNSMLKLLRHPLDNLKIYLNGEQMQKDDTNKFLTDDFYSLMENIFEHVSSDLEFQDLIARLNQY